MTTGDTILFWVTIGIIIHAVGLGLLNFYHACQIWRKIRQRRRD